VQYDKASLLNEYVNLYSAQLEKTSRARNTLVSCKKYSFQAAPNATAAERWITKSPGMS